MFSIKNLQEKNEKEKEQEKETDVSLKDLSALQSITCSVIKSSIADSNKIGVQD